MTDREEETVEDVEVEEEQEEEEAWGSPLDCDMMLDVVSLFAERERGVELGSWGATLSAMGCSCLWLRAPAAACWRMSWWCATRWPDGQDSCCLTRAWACTGE